METEHLRTSNVYLIVIILQPIMYDGGSGGRTRQSPSHDALPPDGKLP